MRVLRVGKNFTVFVLFFGLALLEATSSGHWPAALFWLGVGAFFLLGDNLPGETRGR